tara:strand:+ start:85 stop:276 length:192 start_codon:yes stop_codon:yes gene_type:complete
MDKKEMIQIARTAIDKRMDYETLKYSDYMYGKENLTEEVWEYVIEAEEQGMNWFMETYAEYFC